MRVETQMELLQPTFRDTACLEFSFIIVPVRPLTYSVDEQLNVTYGSGMYPAC